MSNEMTDARALAEIDGYVPRHCRAAIEHIADRLRGEAVQGDQQPVAHVLRIDTPQSALVGLYDDSLKSGDQLYTRPQPVAAPAAPAQDFRALLAEARRQYRDSDAAGDVLAWLDERVLDTDYAAPAPVAGEDSPMCPNCVTPWKCNGPHTLAQDRAAQGAAAVPEDAVCPNCDRLTDIRHCKACGCDFVQDAALRTGGGEA